MDDDTCTSCDGMLNDDGSCPTCGQFIYSKTHTVSIKKHTHLFQGVCFLYGAYYVENFCLCCTCRATNTITTSAATAPFTITSQVVPDKCSCSAMINFVIST